MALVLVMGASSGIGLEVTKQALKAGHSVRAFARSAARIPLADDRLSTWPGDATDGDAVAGALEGVDCVIQVLGIRAGPEMITRPVRLFSKATEILIPAMESAGVKRLIALTGFGAGDSRDSMNCLQRIPFRLFLGRAYDDKDIQERLIRDSALDWVIARPGVLTKGRRTGRYRVLVEPSRWRNGIISRADVADFLVKQIDDDSHLHTTPALIGCPL